MRPDMPKILVERPRPPSRVPRGRDGRRFRDASDAAFLPMKAGYRDLKSLNENLQPLARYLARQVNRPWNAVYREICAVIDARNAVQRHILQHLTDYVALHTCIVRSELIDLGRSYFGPGPVWQPSTCTRVPICCAEIPKSSSRLASDRSKQTVSAPRGGAHSPRRASCTASTGIGSRSRSRPCREPPQASGTRCVAVASRKVLPAGVRRSRNV
jgi:hypothetical protein